jgi:uracil-DNA glycosylase
MIIGEAWGRDEEEQTFPFVGASGAMLLGLMKDTGLLNFTAADYANRNEYFKTKNSYFNRLIWEAHPEIKITNTFNLRPIGRNDVTALCGPKAEGIKGLPALASGKYVQAKYAGELTRLDHEVEETKPNLILCLGNTPLWAGTSSPGVRKMRGYPMWSDRWNCKILTTYHPAAVLRQYNLKPIVYADFNKAKHELSFPELRRPDHAIWIEPTYSDLLRFEGKYLQSYRTLSVDIETQDGQITCLGMSPSSEVALVVPFVDWTKPDRNYWPTLEEELKVWAWVRRILESAPSVLGQNFLYDIRYLWRVYGIRVPGFQHDTMLLHHALQPEMEKGLNFLASLYTTEASWKFMRTESKTLKKED